MAAAIGAATVISTILTGSTDMFATRTGISAAIISTAAIAFMLRIGPAATRMTNFATAAAITTVTVNMIGTMTRIATTAKAASRQSPQNVRQRPWG